jgi:hypothetical protein
MATHYRRQCREVAGHVAVAVAVNVADHVYVYVHGIAGVSNRSVF